MPDGPMNPGIRPPAAITPPQQPQPFEQFAGPGPVPTNQTTTKPRQMPGGGQPGLGEDTTMDPESNGSDVGDGQPPADPPAPVQAVKHSAYVMADIMGDITEANPGIEERTAYLLAKRVLDEFPMTKQADTWNPLNFGNRGQVPDGPITHMVKNMTVKVPERSPSRLQETVQPEHAQQVLEGRVVDPKQIGAPPKQIDGPQPRKMTQAEDGTWDWDQPRDWDKPQPPMPPNPYQDFGV